MEKVNLSNITGSGNVSFNISANFRPSADGKVQADVTVQKNTYGLPSNPKSENNTETYNYLGTPEEVQAGMEADLNLGSYLTISTGV